jgi:predicted alpha/beta-fold hydrolase
MLNLVVLCHGLWGNASHMKPIKEALEKEHKSVTVLNITAFEGTLTYDGVDVCGLRAIDQIKPLLATSKTISFIGYSLGGLILR